MLGVSGCCGQRESTRLIYSIHGAATVGAGDLEGYPRLALDENPVQGRAQKKTNVRRVRSWGV
jgi:hypothetical protein